MSSCVPGYLALLESGELARRVEQAYRHLATCDVCARHCPANRQIGELGACRTGMRVGVASYGPRRDEEKALRGKHGSGTILFSRCSLVCHYCRERDHAADDGERLVEPEELAAMMMELQGRGCPNINLVSPSHVVPQIMAAVQVAARQGLSLPLVYNTAGYDSLEMIRLLDGIVDIYLTDMRYADPATARRLARLPDYPSINQAIVAEMHHQVGDLQLDERGLALRGLLVRHLVLPGDVSGTEAIVRFLAEHVSPDTYLAVIDRYRPAYGAHHYLEVTGRAGLGEVEAARELAVGAGLRRVVGG